LGRKVSLVDLHAMTSYSSNPRNVKIYGSGVINGNGQAWWDGFSGAEILDPNNKYLRPILFLTDNATNIEVSGLHLKDSPCWTTFFVRTKNVVFDNVYIDAVSTNASVSSHSSFSSRTY
jgi:galacturan 1,4-alpha-galacturonidase